MMVLSRPKSTISALLSPMNAYYNIACDGTLLLLLVDLTDHLLAAVVIIANNIYCMRARVSSAFLGWFQF